MASNQTAKTIASEAEIASAMLATGGGLDYLAADGVIRPAPVANAADPAAAARVVLRN